jgi:general secretion pathway protein D
MLAGWMAAAATLSAGTTMAGPWGGTTDILVGTASVAEAAPSATDTKDERQQTADLLRRARQAMAEGDLAAADSLISAAEALNVQYGLLHLGDTPKKARHDLQRIRSAAEKSTARPSGLFSHLSLKKETPQTDPFAGRSGSLSATQLDRNPGAAAELPGLGDFQGNSRIVTDLPRLREVAPLPGSRAADAAWPPTSSGWSRLPLPLDGTMDTGLPEGSLTRLPAVLAGAPDARSTANSKVGAGKAEDLLLEARRALAVGDVRRATGLVNQAKLLHASYAPLDDSPEKVEAAIGQYQEVAAEPVQTEAQRRRKVRMLMGQAEALLRYGDYDRAEQLASQASREKLSYSPFEARPQDLLGRIAAARRQANPSPDASAPGSAVAESSETSAPSLAAKQKAAELSRAARDALEAGQLGRAETLARQAEQLGVPDSAFARGEDRPGLVLLDIRRQSLGDASGVRQASGQYVSPATGTLPVDRMVSRAVYDPSNDPTRNVRAASEQPRFPGNAARPDLAQNMPARPPLEPLPPVDSVAPLADADVQSGPALFARGEAALRAHDTDAAYQYYRQAAAHLDEFDPITRQRLQERLQLLSAPRAERDHGLPSAAHENPPPDRRSDSIVDQTAAQQQALARQVYADIAHQASKARAMLPSDPKGALALMEEARQAVEVAGLEPTAREQLLQHVDRHVAEMRQFIEQHRGRIELEEKSQQTRDEIEREQRLKLDIQEKLALMVDDFNKKMHEQRYAEAEVVAKRAAELAPEEAVVQQLLNQAKFVKQFFRNQALQAEKQQAVLDTLGAVEQSSVPFNDLNPYVFPDAKTWEEYTSRRSRFLREQGRHRSEKELEIERKLRTPVSLSFANKPLSEVLDYLANLTGVNLYLDPQGLAQEGITSDTPVSIEVHHEIMFKSALNLILEPLHLSYLIKDEVLKITSEQLRNGEVYTISYNVADLVVPIPNFVPGDAGLTAAYHKALGNVGFGGQYNAATPPLAVMASKEGKQSTAAINPGILAQVSTPGQPATGVGNMPTGFGPGGLGGASQADFDALIDLITATIEPTSWDSVGGPGSIAPFETNLSIVVSQTQEVHEQIVDLLEQLRRMQDLQVTIEVRFITLNDNFFERLGVDFDFDINDNIDRPFQVFGRADPNTSSAYTTDFTTNTGPPRDVQDRDQTQSVTVGLGLPDVFSADLDIPFRQGSFQMAVPQFGGFAADAGAQVGFAILSDIEAFFFINAAQGDRRSNVLQAPKVTLFNGQQAYVSDTSQSPFVVSVIPVVGDFAAAQQPVIVVLSEGTFMTVQAVVSNDRRFVRLTVVPFFSRIGEVNTFQFTGSETTTTNTTAEGIQDNPNDNTRSSNASTVTRSGTTVQLPTFSYVQVTTTVSVPDGGTVLLGGIKRLSEGRNEFGVPMLDKLPYINRLFKNVGIGRETQSLMMMVTPRIIIQEEEEVAQTGYTPPP